MGMLDKIKALSPHEHDNLQGALQLGMVGAAVTGVTIFALGAIAFLNLEHARRVLHLHPDSVQLLAAHKKFSRHVIALMSGGFVSLLPIVPLSLSDVYLDRLNVKKMQK